MIVQDVIDRVLKQFGDEASVQITQTDIIRWINDGTKEIAIKNNLLQTTALQNVTAGTNTYNFPSDMLAMQAMYYDKLKIAFMKRSEYDVYVNANDPQEVQTGVPYMWTRWGTQFTLYPKPSSDLTNGIKILYIQVPGDVSLPADTLSFSNQYHNRIVEYVLQQCYETDEDWDASTQKQAQFNDGLDTLKAKEEFVERETYPTITVLMDDM